MMPQKNRGRYFELILNTLLFALGNLGSKFLVFILMPLYTNALTTSEYGVSELVLTGTNLLIPFVSISVQDAVLRFSLDPEKKSGEVIKAATFVISIGSLITCIFYPFLHLYKAISDWTTYFVIITIVYMFRNCFSIYVKAIGKTVIYTIDSVLYTALLMVTNIVFLTVTKWGLRGYFYAIIISSIISILYLLISGKIIRSCIKEDYNWKLLKEMLLFSSPMILNNVSWWIINSSDKVMIEYFLSASESGIYSVAAKMPSLLATFTNIFNQAWIISSISEYDSGRDDKFFSGTFTVFNTCLVLLSSVVVAVIKPFMGIYVGADFTTSWQYVPLLLLGSIFQSYATFFGAIYTSARKNTSVATTTFMAAVVNIVLNAALIPWIGVQGAVIATAVSYCVVFIFRMIDSQKYMKFKIYFGRIGLSFALLLFQCLVAIKEWHTYLFSILVITFLVIINWHAIHTITEKVLCRIRKR